MAEARKRHLKEMAGSGVDLLMNPSNGVRFNPIKKGTST